MPELKEGKELRTPSESVISGPLLPAQQKPTNLENVLWFPCRSQWDCLIHNSEKIVATLVGPTLSATSHRMLKLLRFKYFQLSKREHLHKSVDSQPRLSSLYLRGAIFTSEWLSWWYILKINVYLWSEEMWFITTLSDINRAPLCCSSKHRLPRHRWTILTELMPLQPGKWGNWELLWENV